MFHFSSDFPAIIDHTETVILRRHDTMDEVTLTQVLVRPVLQTGAIAPGAAAQRRMHFQLPTGIDPPRVADVLIDASGREQPILMVQDCNCQLRWVCTV